MFGSAGRFSVVDLVSTPVELYSLASGSSGNALFIRTCEITMLVDCGISPRQLRSRLDQCGSSVGEIDVVFLSHEHGDHVSGLRAFTGMGTEIITSRGTAGAIGLARGTYREVRSGQTVEIGHCTLTPYSVSHDASEPLAAHIEVETQAITVATDLGEASDEIVEALRFSDVAILEANHDLEMLRNGPYPRQLKRRVLSKRGHLSNIDCAQVLAGLAVSSNRLHSVWLAHLSTTNNLPTLAAQTVRSQNLQLVIEPLPRTQVKRLEGGTSMQSESSPSFRQPALW